MHKIIVKVVTLPKCHLVPPSIRSGHILTCSFKNFGHTHQQSSVSSLSPIFRDNNVHRYSVTGYHDPFIWSQLRVLSFTSSSYGDDGHNLLRIGGENCHHLYQWLALKRRNFTSQPPQSNSSLESKKVATDIVEVKKPLVKRIKDELMHYVNGFRLLSLDVKLCIRLLWRRVRGNDLSRKESQQIIRTTADLLRLFPFFIILLLPFGGLALPICAKFYPYLLPSTFQSDHDKENRENQQLPKKLRMAKILLKSLEDASSKPWSPLSSEDSKKLIEFFGKARKKGEQPPNRDIIRFMDIFENKITLESFNRSQLIALCKFLGLVSLGPSNFLRYRLRTRLRGLKVDDQMIIKEGIDNLSESELREACQVRGMRGFHLSTEQLKNQLSQWLELSLDDRTPPSLLLLSRVLYLPENLPTSDKLNTTIPIKKSKSKYDKDKKIKKDIKL